MGKNDYSDDPDYYNQDFEKPSIVSIWIGLNEMAEGEGELDVLQDLCGVGYYSLDDLESDCLEFKLVPIASLMQDLSYASSFLGDALEKSSMLGFTHARWVIAQYDFQYDPTRVVRRIAEDPMFLGSFVYSR